MTHHWTEARISAALKGRFYGLDGKCRREERERERRAARELADKARAELRASVKNRIASAGRINASAIIEAVAVAHHVDAEAITGNSRKKGIPLARQHACALIRELTGLSFYQIATAIGKDHSTVIFSVGKFEQMKHHYTAQDRIARQVLGVI